MSGEANTCQLEAEAVEGPLSVTDEPPSSQMLSKAASLEVLDRDGKPHTFKSLYDGPETSSRVVFIFIRHFFCGASQAYVQLVSSTLTPEKLSSHRVPTSIVVIGCGSPSLINEYAEITNCPFPIYTDQTEKLLDALGMMPTFAVGNRTTYSPQRWIFHFARGMYNLVVNLPSGRIYQAGNPQRVGGEFVFEGAQNEKTVSWCHRMRNHRDHTEVEELCRVLDLEESGTQQAE